MWEVTDSEGRIVVLTFERWRHIVERHESLHRRNGEVLQAVADPEDRLQGRRPGEEWFYGRSAPPEKWIKVVVHFEEDRGQIVTRVSAEVDPMIDQIPGVTIGGIVFDNVTYDRDADVLYLWAGEPRRPTSDDASPEGHYLQFGENGELIAMTIVNARWLDEQDGKIVVTLPDGSRLQSAAIGAALAAA